MNIFPNILLWKNFQNIIKLKNFYSGHVHIHHPHSTIGFLCYFSPTSSPVYPFIYHPILFFDAFQRKLQISVNLFLNTSTCYTTFLCISCISIFNCSVDFFCFFPPLFLYIYLCPLHVIWCSFFILNTI